MIACWSGVWEHEKESQGNSSFVLSYFLVIFFHPSKDIFLVLASCQSCTLVTHKKYCRRCFSLLSSNKSLMEWNKNKFGYYYLKHKHNVSIMICEKREKNSPRRFYDALFRLVVVMDVCVVHLRVGFVICCLFSHSMPTIFSMSYNRAGGIMHFIKKNRNNDPK
jgi:hypothetical protein